MVHIDSNTPFITYEKEIVKEFTLCRYGVTEVCSEYMSVAGNIEKRVPINKADSLTVNVCLHSRRGLLMSLYFGSQQITTNLNSNLSLLDCASS
jgi:hypothetical protein